jgi:hypothetical protein
MLPVNIADLIGSPENSDLELYMADIAVRMLYALFYFCRIPFEGERLRGVGI